MFKKIKWKLVILNSTVVAILFFAFSFILYQFMFKELDRRINEDLFGAAEKIQRQEIHKVRPTDPRIGIIMYLKDGRVLTSQNIDGDVEEIIEFKKDIGRFRDIKTDEGFWYRIFTKKVLHPEVEYIEVIRNISSEHEQQELLKWVLVFGSVLSCFISIGVGYGLAHYSLIPIQRSWDQQRRFTGDASHELRTPLAVIQGSTEQLLQEPEKTVIEHSETISRILKETRRMNRLIADLLLLAKTDGDGIVLKKEQVNVYNLVEEVVSYFEDVAISREIQFNLICKDRIMAEVDEERIKQLIINLLDNGMKYTGEGGAVTLKVYEYSGKLVLSVEDTGIGISKEHHKRLFDRFYRVSDDRKRNDKGGYGLGLSIVKWIVDSHGGEIYVKSELGKGTNMIVEIPLK